MTQVCNPLMQRIVRSGVGISGRSLCDLNLSFELGQRFALGPGWFVLFVLDLFSYLFLQLKSDGLLFFFVAESVM